MNVRVDTGSVVQPRARLLWSIALTYLATWILLSWLTSPSLDPYGDMIENYAWSQTWALGSFKHPPLFAWMVRAWFAVFPTRVWAYYVLSYVNAGAGLLGIVFLARLWLPESISRSRRDVFLLAVLLFAMLSIPYSNLAAKFNADTVLLSLWPWTAYAFFASLRARTSAGKWAFTLLFGVMGAAAMLGKYYSGLLLATLFMVSVSDGTFRRWYLTIYPYVALSVFVVALLPHAVWELQMHFPFRQYFDTKFDTGVDVPRIALFLLSGIYYLPLSWLAWLVLRTRFRAPHPQPVAWALPIRALMLVCVLPAVLTACLGALAHVHLTTHWAIPVWFALPVLMAVWLLPHVGERFAWSRLAPGLIICWVLLLAGGVIYTVVLSTEGDPRYSLARPEMVDAIESRFTATFPQQRLSWAGGTWPEPGAVAFFAPDHPRALPGLPDSPRAAVSPYEAWPHTYGVIVCVASDRFAREGAHDTMCEGDAREWLLARHVSVQEETLTYRAAGWQFARSQPKNVTVFWVPPATR